MSLLVDEVGGGDRERRGILLWILVSTCDLLVEGVGGGDRERGILLWVLVSTCESLWDWHVIVVVG